MQSSSNEIILRKKILIILYIGFISLGLPDAILGVSWPEMRLSFGSPLELAGWILSLTTVISALSSIGSGFFINSSCHNTQQSLPPLSVKRFFSRPWNTGMILSVSAALTTIAMLGYSLAPSIYFIFAFTLLFGIGQGAVDSSVNSYMAKNYSASHMNWIHCCWGIGASAGPMLISIIFGIGFSWRFGYFLIALIQTTLSLIFFLTLKLWDQPQTKFTNRDDSGADSLNSSHPVLGHSHNIPDGSFVKACAGIVFYFFYSGLEIVTGLWGASYMMLKFNSSPAFAGAAIAMFWASLTAGRLLAGFIAIKINGKTLIRCFLSVSLVASVLIFISSQPIIFMFALILAGFGLAPLYPSMMHETPKRLKPMLADKIIAFQVGAALSGAALLPLLIGYLGRGKKIIPYDKAMLIFCIIVIMAHEISTFSRNKSNLPPKA